MTEEIKKTEPATPAVRSHADPFESMRREMDRVLDNFLGRRWMDTPTLLSSRLGTEMVSPSIDVRESPTEISIEAELPGMAEEDVDISLSDGVLTIKGEKKSEREEKEDDYHLTERSYGRFQRSFRMPNTVDEDQVQAKLENGVLHLTLPKRPEAVKAEKKIPIGGN